MITVRNALSNELCTHVAASLLIKENQGALEDDNSQVVGSKVVHGDASCETLLIALHEKMEHETGLKLIPTYSFARIYRQGDSLGRHKDRPACEISATLTLWNYGVDSWLIYGDGESVDLSVGDMLIYRGCDVEHWRDPLSAGVWVQVFLHYIDADGPYANQAFDGRTELADFYTTLKEECINGRGKGNNM